MPGEVPARHRSTPVTQQIASGRPGRFGRPRRRLRAGLVQLLFALAGLVLGLLLPRITAEPSVAASRVTETLVGVGSVARRVAPDRPGLAAGPKTRPFDREPAGVPAPVPRGARRDVGR